MGCAAYWGNFDVMIAHSMNRMRTANRFWRPGVLVMIHFGAGTNWCVFVVCIVLELILLVIKLSECSYNNACNISIDT